MTQYSMSLGTWEAAARGSCPLEETRFFLKNLVSENSKDVLSWNLFRTLERIGHPDVIARAPGLDDEFQVLYFYQLLRHLVLANELCRPGRWPLEPHLLVVVNELSLNRNGESHAAEFEEFRRALRLAPEQTHLLTWQELLVRAEATFDLSVRPLLAHARRLSYLRPL